MRLSYLDSIRALAALYVFLNHAYVFQFGGLAAKGAPGDVFLYGRIAVDCFIVLSGFCLSLNAKAPIDYWQFIKRRSRRILPPYYAAVLLGALVLIIRYKQFYGFYLAIPLQAWLVNLLLVNEMFPVGSETINGALWAVALEYKIYFFLPLLVWVYRRYGDLLTLLAATFIAAAWYALVYPINGANGASWYIVLFAFGVIAAQQLHKRSHPLPFLFSGFTALSVLLAAFPFYEAFASVIVPIDLSAGLCFAALLLLLGKHQNNFAVKVLERPAFVWLASWSYSLYLIHQPLLKYANQLMRGHVQGWAAIALETIPVLTCCYLFSLAFERPFLRHR